MSIVYLVFSYFKADFSRIKLALDEMQILIVKTFGWFSFGFYDISIFVDYLNQFLYK